MIFCGKNFSTKTFQEQSSSSSTSTKKKGSGDGDGDGDEGNDDGNSDTDSTDDENDWKENYLEIVFKWKTLSGNFYFRENGTGKNQYNWDRISTAEFQTIPQGLILDDEGKPFAKKVKKLLT